MRASIGNLRGGASIGSLRGGPVVSSDGRARNPIVRSLQPSIEGTLDPAILEKYVRARLSAFRECYGRALRNNAGAKGDVVLHWTIASDGRVGEARVQSSTLEDPETLGCLTSLVNRWRLPNPGATLVAVSYPFSFYAD